MTKIFTILLITLISIGCSSLKLESVSSSEEITEQILDLGLSHEENIVEAGKLKNPSLIKAVNLLLMKARDEKVIADADFKEATKVSDMVKMSDSGLDFIGPKVTNVSKTGILDTDLEHQDFYLISSKDSDSGLISHKLNLSIKHNSIKKRDYLSATLCDKWNNCNNEDEMIEVISARATNCSGTTCDFIETIELDLSDNFLKSQMNTGLMLRFNAKKKASKVKVSKGYLMGYLTVTN
tara:strand:- start:847 stop:1560 length:714 start_codon:yes stop_codon:yes gene_type:complete